MPRTTIRQRWGVIALNRTGMTAPAILRRTGIPRRAVNGVLSPHAVRPNDVKDLPRSGRPRKGMYGMGLGLFNDDTCPSGHISRPTHFSDILCNSFVFFNYVVIWILWFVGFNVPYLTFIDLSDQVEESSLLQIFNENWT